MFDFFTTPFFHQTFFGNTLLSYTIALGTFVGIILAIKLFQLFLLNKLTALARRTPTDIDNVLLKIIQKINPPFFVFIAFYFAAQELILPHTLKQILHIIFIAWLVYQGIRAASFAIDFTMKKYLNRQENEASRAAIETLSLLIKAACWILGALLLLSNIGINVTSLIAGLGIGGIAIAFALQNILKDVFSSFVIFSDKPFVVGDFIIVGDKMGTVEKIGIQTTRLRALQGEEIVISNQELITAQLQNFASMKERRVVLTFSVDYKTSHKKLREISEIVKNIIDGIKQTTFDRAHFSKFGEAGLVFEVVYYVKSGEYVVYMDKQQEINFALHDAFEKEGINMAYPLMLLQKN